MRCTAPMHDKRIWLSTSLKSGLGQPVERCENLLRSSLRKTLWTMTAILPGFPILSKREFFGRRRSSSSASFCMFHLPTGYALGFQFSRHEHEESQTTLKVGHANESGGRCGVRSQFARQCGQSTRSTAKRCNTLSLIYPNRCPIGCSVRRLGAW